MITLISYEPFFKTLEKNKITSYHLLKKMEFPASIYHKMKNNTGGINTGTIDTLCQLLDCTVSEIIEYVPDKKE